MKLTTIALGAGIGIGYLAANEDARQKAWAALQSAKESRSAKSVEEKVTGAVSGAVSQLADKRRSNADDLPISNDSISADTISPAKPVTTDRSVIG